jgi:hypothetical protein
MACLFLLYFYVMTSEEPGPESYLELMDEIKGQKQNTFLLKLHFVSLSQSSPSFALHTRLVSYIFLFFHSS